MNNIGYITQCINRSIKNVFSGINPDKMRIEGVAYTAIEKNSDSKDRKFPVIYKGGEDYDEIVINDAYDLIIYHKPQSVNGRQDGKSGAYGNSRGDITSITKVALVVWGKKDVLNLSPDELGLQIQIAFPDRIIGNDLKNLNFKSVLVTVNDINLSEESVFSNEYKNVDYFIKPNYCLIQVNYSVECTFTKKCLQNNCGA